MTPPPPIPLLKQLYGEDGVFTYVFADAAI